MSNHLHTGSALKPIKLHSPRGAMATFYPEKGGLMTSLQLLDPEQKPRELLYYPQNLAVENIQKISVGWPFCFPICARLSRQGASAYLYQHHLYHMDIHGFAHALPWEVIEQSSDSLTIRLSDSSESYKQYPFRFHVTLRYRLYDHHLECHQTYHNRGDQPLPYYAGFHPYFWMDPARYSKSQVKISFNALKRLRYTPDLTDIAGQADLLPLPAMLDQPEINESLWLLGEDHTVCLHFPDGSRINLSVQGTQAPLFNYLQLYHIPEEPFFCIEPWMSHPNSLNTLGASRWLAAGSTDHANLKLSLN